MGTEREIGWTPKRMEMLRAARDGELRFKGSCGLGGGYQHRGEFIFGPEEIPVVQLVHCGALTHTDTPPHCTGPIRLTAEGDRLLTKWRDRRV